MGTLAVVCGAFTYATIVGLVPYRPTSGALLYLLIVNIAVALVLGSLVVWRLTRLWIEGRSQAAGARLHARLVAIFSAVAVIPAVMVAIFAAVTLNLGIEAWFSARVQAALNASVNVAERYGVEHERLIVGDAYEIANAIERDPTLFGPDSRVNPGMLFAKLADLTKDHGLQASYIFDSQGHLLGSAKQKFLPELNPPKPGDIAQAAHGTIVIDANSKVGVVRALIRLQALNDAYLLVVRSVDPQVFAYFQHMADVVSEYKRLENNRTRVQLVFAVLYGIVSLLVLLAAIWLGLWAANRLVRPISRLINAAEQVSRGDLKVQVDVHRDDDEIATLGRAFNRMTAQLDAQRSELVEASHQIDARRRFTEAVLAGVSAGVIGLDGEGRITIVNRAAARLLNVAPEDLAGRAFDDAVPELTELIARAIHEPYGRASGEANVVRGSTTRNLSVHVDSEAGPEAGYIVTFDDITDLVSAQRTAAWADVARRIAHEIKNPLTPIQLSAERLKRKYESEIVTDPDVFRRCTDTIIRQVGDIGRMVDEFSSFARMPTPTMRREYAQELMQQAVFLQREANPEIDFAINAPEKAVTFECDGRLVAQALTNILKNATEAVSAREHGSAGGRIVICLEQDDSSVTFRVMDNGIGLPTQHRHRLTEPYVTTRAKGTGLGLAIVRKVVEDHGGEIALQDRADAVTGAEVRLTFPLHQKAAAVQSKRLASEVS
jgi:two-component system nitrogen regulation sensor histidine kinase NtrY